jgi:hypothetical protein
MKGKELAACPKLAVLLVQIVWLGTSLALPPDVSIEPDHLLPWLAIAEKVRQDVYFCQNGCSQNADAPGGAGNETAGLIADANYAHLPNEQLCVKLSALSAASSAVESVYVNIAKWQNNSWGAFTPAKALFDGEQITLVDGLKDEGFFKLQFTLNAPDRQPSSVETYAIARRNWKKDILTFCRRSKEEIESNPDLQLVFSCLAASHFDHTMESASASAVLSGKILKALADAVDGRKAFEAGQCPDLVIGLNKIRLKRFEGAEPALFVVFVPEDYDSSRKWPLYLYPDAKNFYRADNYSQRSGMIDVWWELPDWIELEWKDYEFILNIVGSKLNLNEDRFYLYGHCGNGIPAMALALNHPDQWAECSTLLGNSYRHLAGNALNLPFVFIAGQLQEGPISGYSEFAAKCFQHYGCRNFKCGRENQVVQTRGTPLPEAIREKDPRRVLYTIESLGNPRAYWVTILGRKDENLTATIDAEVDGQTILVRTKNIDAYCLDLLQAPVDSNIPVEIVEDGRSLGKVSTKVFTSCPDAYTGATYVKNASLHGPIGDAFTDPFVVVWGTAGNRPRFVQAGRKAALSLANGAPCFAEANLPEGLLQSHNLILVGTPESNRYLARISETLPVKIKQGQIITDGLSYTGSDMGIIMVYPNPINPQRYVAVFAAVSARAMAGMPRAYSAIESMTRSSDLAQYADMAVFELTEQGEIKWRLLEKFNTMWQYHPAWKEIVASTDKKHPKWQWRQWVARALRLQLQADVVICEDPFRFSYSTLDGEITRRDLFNNLKNDWIVKTSLSGENLRNILAAWLTRISKNSASEVSMDGVSFARTAPDQDPPSLAVNDLENDKSYTVAFSYALLNGEKLGIVFRDYEIVGEGYLVPLLTDRLHKSKQVDLDARLDSFKPAMF